MRMQLDWERSVKDDGSLRYSLKPLPNGSFCNVIVRDKKVTRVTKWGHKKSIKRIFWHIDEALESGILWANRYIQQSHPIRKRRSKHDMEVKPLHDSTFKFHDPTNKQLETLQAVRTAAKQYSDCLEALIPSGPDKTYLLRKLREVSMWANVAITRHADGTPRED